MDPYFIAFGRTYRPSSSPFRMMPRHRPGTRGVVWRRWVTRRAPRRVPAAQVTVPATAPTVASHPA